MPSGAKKRKAAKKKQQLNDSPTTTNPHQEVEVVKREDSSSEMESKNVNEQLGDVEIERESKLKNSSSSSSDSSDDESHVVEKKVVVLESVPAVESLPEKISPIVDPVKPVDSLLEEVSQVFDGIMSEEKKDLVVEETRVVEEQAQVVDEIKDEEKKDLVVEETHVVEEERKVDDCEAVVKDGSPDSSVVVEPVLKENEVEKLEPLVEKVSLESRDDVSSSTPPKDLISDANGADRVDEIEKIEHSDRQAPAASTTVAVQNTTSWKSCCGIFELFSGSGQ